MPEPGPSSSSSNTTQMNSSYQKRFFFGDITQEVQNIQEENNLNNEDKIKKLGEILDRVESEAPSINVSNTNYSTGEYFLHSRVLKDTSELTKRCTEEVTGEANNYDKFLLAQNIAENPDFWDFALPYEVPAVSYLYGTFAPTPLEQRPRVPRRRVERQRAGDLKVAQKVDQLRKPDEGPEKVDQVLHFLRKACRNGPISYFHVALDPDSFTRTIENIYHLSFLARDGLVSVTLDEQTGLPFIKRLSEEKKRRENDAPTGNQQFVVSMNMERWKDLVQAFGIRQAMMKV